MSRSTRSILHFATTLLFTAITLALALIVSPRLERALGAERFGAWRILLEAAGYLSLLEMGLSGSLGPVLAKQLGQSQRDQIDQTLMTALRAYLRVIVLTVVIGAALTFLVPQLIRDVDAREVQVAWVISLGGALAVIATPLRAWLEANQLGYRVNLLLVGQAIVVAGGSLWLATNNWGIEGQAVALVAGNLVFAVLLCFLCRNRLRAVMALLWKSQRDCAAERQLMATGRPILITSIAGRASILTDQIIVGAMLGSVAVTRLFFTQRLAIMAQGVLQGIGGSTWAALAELHVRGESEQFRKRVLDLTRWSAALACASLGSIVLWNRAFVRLWTHDANLFAGEIVIVIAALNTVLLTLFSLWSWVLTATGHANEVARPSLVSAIVNVAASIAFTNRFGLIGPLLGTLLAFVTINLWWLPLRLRAVFGISPARLVISVVRPLIITGCVVEVAGGMAFGYEPTTWLELATVAMLTSLIMLMVLSGPTEMMNQISGLAKRVRGSLR